MDYIQILHLKEGHQLGAGGRLCCTLKITHCQKLVLDLKNTCQMGLTLGGFVILVMVSSARPMNCAWKPQVRKILTSHSSTHYLRLCMMKAGIPLLFYS
nr:hypothetical protein Iba_chr09bCG4190 [Ipomoea batatas]GMD33581.1 hypothetical protein Iba_chr09cCG3970 [Ipomoea batatas]GMD35304.1 hypothetical protein Iba_chr09dCG5690 [Ipomoea batatas]GMD38548.1 hypothetical protein Iba_chr09fCG5030 [Ipomoea batatas]